MISLDKEYRTRDGRKVRLLCVDGPDNSYPVVGIVRGSTSTCQWMSNGWRVISQERSLDLVEVADETTRMNPNLGSIANAELMADAPEMYEILQKLVGLHVPIVSDDVGEVMRRATELFNRHGRIA